ncbi:MAG TPA: hypothetical protein VEX38_07870, partial [Fimbriimonadaceae bacterium]|nr:hypothetical protein [Fimbriimonadaceae bacterium]
MPQGLAQTVVTWLERDRTGPGRLDLRRKDGREIARVAPFFSGSTFVGVLLSIPIRYARAGSGLLQPELLRERISGLIPLASPQNLNQFHELLNACLHECLGRGALGNWSGAGNLDARLPRARRASW